MSSHEQSLSLLDASRPIPTEALLQLNDVYGLVDGPRVLDDVDAEVETDVGNSGMFHNGNYRIDAWPDACLHLATHIADVRDDQINRLHQQLTILGFDPEQVLTPELITEIASIDHKIATRARSAGQIIEIVLNHANRSKHIQGENGNAFYAGVTVSGLIYYAQKHYLLDLLRDGRIVELHRVKNSDNGGLWPDGEQFRSSEVANTRSFPNSREPEYDLKVPEQDAPIEIVWIDKFGNCLLRLRESESYTGLFVPGQKLELVVEGSRQLVIVGTDLDHSDTDVPTLYYNPATTNPKIIDLVIKSEDCLSGRGHALEFIRKLVRHHIALKDLRKLALDLEPA
jgi:hypothetical protein